MTLRRLWRGIIVVTRAFGAGIILMSALDTRLGLMTAHHTLAFSIGAAGVVFRIASEHSRAI